jgi:two-component system chemotaxis response regulator CheY
MAIPQGISILVAEDDKTTRDAVVSDLKSLGFQGDILEAENGKEAIDKLNEYFDAGGKIDFILSDMVMPIATGFDFLTNLRAQAKYKDIPFMMLTSKNDREFVLQCAKAGVSNYLVKPWNVQVLAEKMHACWVKHHGE